MPDITQGWHIGFCHLCADLGLPCYRDCSCGNDLTNYKTHVRFAAHNNESYVCTYCHKDLGQKSKLQKHYCVKAEEKFKESGYETYTEKQLDSEVYKLTAKMSNWEKFRYFDELKLSIPDTFPLMSVPRGNRHLKFEDYGCREGNLFYRRILKEKVLAGQENQLIVPKRVKVIGENGVTKFLLDETVLLPKHKKILVEDHGPDHAKLSLKRPPKLKERKPLSKILLDSLSKLKSYLSFTKTKGFEHNPHE